MSFNDWVNSIADAGRDLLSRGTKNEKTIQHLCDELASNKGEALGTALACAVVTAYDKKDASGKLEFFQYLLRDYSPNREVILRCADAYRQNSDDSCYQALAEAVDGPMKRLFRRINMAPKGTETVVKMRRDLLVCLRDHKELKPVDDVLFSLMCSWFNRGFLTLHTINWKTPAHILEKLIAYEAVHEMKGWIDLRRRLADDRRCFAFFHPALPDEPLIFVQVALVNGLSNSVQALLEQPSEDQSCQDFDSATFYSISNCQKGLLGVSFGNFLIKQVVMELQKEFPTLKNFSTLSPIPGFKVWLDKEMTNPGSSLICAKDRNILAMLETENWHSLSHASDHLEPILMRLCAHYLRFVKRGNKPIDPVARFHLGNGARIERLNWLADTSANGLKKSLGILVNYGYKLDQVEVNHELFVNDHEVVVSKDVQKLLDG